MNVSHYNMKDICCGRTLDETSDVGFPLCAALVSQGKVFFSWSKWFPHWPEWSASWLTEMTLSANDCHDVLVEPKSKNCATAPLTDHFYASWALLTMILIISMKEERPRQLGLNWWGGKGEHLNPRWTLVSLSCGHYYKELVSVERRTGRFHLNRGASMLLSALRGFGHGSWSSTKTEITLFSFLGKD